MIINNGTNILVSGAFQTCFSIVKLGFTGVYIIVLIKRVIFTAVKIAVNYIGVSMFCLI